MLVVREPCEHFRWMVAGSEVMIHTGHLNNTVLHSIHSGIISIRQFNYGRCCRTPTLRTALGTVLAIVGTRAIVSCTCKESTPAN